MARSGVFALSSLFEGFGNVLCEALACGCPVVSTDCPGGPREILDQCRHGGLVPVGDDRAMAQSLLLALRTDPVEERRRSRQAPTMAELAADYLERHAIPKKRPKSVRDDRSMLNNAVLPQLRSKKVQAVTRRDIESIHVALKDRPYQANRVLALLSKMFALAVEWGWRPDNPVKGMERYHEEKRDRWLSNEELRRLSDVLDRHPNQRAANAVRLQLLTGA